MTLFDTSMMQEKLYIRHPHRRESPLHCTESAPNEFPSFIDSDMASVPVGIPAQLRTWHYPLAPATANSDSALATVFSSAALNFERAPYEASHDAFLIPLTDRDYGVDAYPRSWEWYVAAQPESIHVSYAPQTTLEEENTPVVQSNRSQVPSEMADLSLLGEQSAQPSDHAVEAPTQTQPPSHPTFPWLSVQQPDSLAVSTRPMSRAQARYQDQDQTQAPITSTDLLGYRMADSVPEQAPPRIVINTHRRRHRGTRTRPERVVCDQCRKLMCRQSLKRHIREVHDKIKRSHSKSTIAAAGFL